MVSSGAEIQIDKGSYTRIHNAILEQLAYHDFTSREYACILYLLRMTYGFSRKDCQLSNGDFADATNLERTAIIKTLRRLVERSVFIKIDGDPYHAATWSFNKYVEQWDTQTSVKTTTSRDDTGSQIDTTTSSRFDTSSSSQNDTSASDETTTSYLWTKESIKENSKDNSKERENTPAPNQNGYFGMPYPHRREKMNADAYTQQAQQLGVSAADFVAMANQLVDTAKWKSLIDDVGETKWLDYAKQDAIRLIRLGNNTPEHITRLIDMYKTVNHWRGDAPILPRQLTEFAGQVKDGLTVQDRKERTNGDNRSRNNGTGNGYVSEAEANYQLSEQYR